MYHLLEMGQFLSKVSSSQHESRQLLRPQRFQAGFWGSPRSPPPGHPLGVATACKEAPAGAGAAVRAQLPCHGWVPPPPGPRFPPDGGWAPPALSPLPPLPPGAAGRSVSRAQPQRWAHKVCYGCHACHRRSFTLGPWGPWGPAGPFITWASAPRSGQCSSGHDEWLQLWLEGLGERRHRSQAEAPRCRGPRGCGCLPGKGPLSTRPSLCPSRRVGQEVLSTLSETFDTWKKLRLSPHRRAPMSWAQRCSEASGSPWDVAGSGVRGHREGQDQKSLCSRLPGCSCPRRIARGPSLADPTKPHWGASCETASQGSGQNSIAERTKMLSQDDGDNGDVTVLCSMESWDQTRGSVGWLATLELRPEPGALSTLGVQELPRPAGRRRPLIRTFTNQL